MNTPLEAFADRRAAGAALADLVPDDLGPRPLVLALPRGGVPVAFHLADRKRAPLDVLVSRRIVSPHDPGAVLGAVAETGAVWLDEYAMRYAGVRESELSASIANELLHVERSARLYREGSSRPSFEGRTVVLVDDGVVTGASAHAAILAARELDPRSLVLAVPVAERATIELLRPLVDALVVARPVAELGSLARWYHELSPVTDGEVLALMRLGRRPFEAALDSAVP